MRETNFIKQNQEKWKDFEQTLQREHKEPDKLKEIFIQTTDDLSYARTFYPNRSVRVYLNALSQCIFSNFYKKQTIEKRSHLVFFQNRVAAIDVGSSVGITVGIHPICSCYSNWSH